MGNLQMRACVHDCMHMQCRHDLTSPISTPYHRSMLSAQCCIRTIVTITIQYPWFKVASIDDRAYCRRAGGGRESKGTARDTDLKPRASDVRGTGVGTSKYVQIRRSQLIIRDL